MHEHELLLCFINAFDMIYLFLVRNLACVNICEA